MMALPEDLAIETGKVESVPVLLRYVALQSRQGNGALVTGS